MTNMGYQRITTYLTTLFPTGDTWLFILAGIGAALSIARRRRMGEFFAVMAVLAALAFRFMPQSILWNARVLPFWFLALYLLGGLAVAEAYAIMAERTTNFMVTLRAALLPAPLIVLVLVFIWVGFPLRILPGEHATANGNYSFLGIPQKAVSFIPGWVTWNYSGYQAGCPQSCAKTRWPEYQQIVAQLEKASQTYGCGNVMWEYQSEMNDYGTPDALTILPYWTNGCIGSMEGLYYEASATTPFHFINQSELSLQPSDPMVGIPYASAPDVALGVQHLQMLGVKYYMALNTELQEPGGGRSVVEAHLDVRAVLHQLHGQWRQRPEWDAEAVLEAVPRKGFRPGARIGGPAGSHERPQQLEPAQVPESYDHLVRRPERLERLPGCQRAVQLGAGAVRRHERTCQSRADHPGERRRRAQCLHQLQRFAARRPGRGDGLLLPQLARFWRRRGVPDKPQPHGRGADLPPREPVVRLYPRRLRGLGADPARTGRSGLPDPAPVAPVVAVRRPGLGRRGRARTGRSRGGREGEEPLGPRGRHRANLAHPGQTGRRTNGAEAAAAGAGAAGGPAARPLGPVPPTPTSGRPGHTTVGLMTMGSSKKGMRRRRVARVWPTLPRRASGTGTGRAAGGRGGPPPPDRPHGRPTRRGRPRLRRRPTGRDGHSRARLTRSSLRRPAPAGGHQRRGRDQRR